MKKPCYQITEKYYEEIYCISLAKKK